MPDDIDRQSFSEACLSEVQGFQCGELPHEKEVSDWLKRPIGEVGALASISDKKRPAKVWLYKLKGEQEKTLIGYGALAKANWNWKGEDDPRIPVTVVIWYGIDKDFQGKPEGDREQRYSRRIFDDLMDIAYQERETRPVMTLLVDVKNKKAIAFYESFGFTNENMMVYREGGEEYQRMYIILDNEAHVRILEAAFAKRKK